MTYFQNPFNSEFLGVLLLADRHLSPTWKVKGNVNDSFLMLAWNTPPYDLSVETDLTINFSLHPDSIGIHRNYASITIDLTTAAASVSAVTAAEVAEALNNNTTFSSYFEAIVDIEYNTGDAQLKIRAKSNFRRETSRVFISNSGAESVLRFNKMAGVAELPSYFGRHTITEANNFSDSNAMLIELDPLGSPIDATIVDEAGLDSSTVREDYELLTGRSGLFTFKNQTVDGSDRITEIIEYPAGAKEGDFAKKSTFTYTGANTNPDEVFEEPHVLESGDLITPP